MARMKPKTARTLSGLVALKRQQAEQAFAAARADLAAEKDKLDALQAELRSTPDASEDFEAAALSDRFGHSRRLLSLIEAQQAEIQRKTQTLDERRNALKRAFGSERALGDIISGEL